MDITKDHLLGRKIIEVNSPNSEALQLSVLQWNVLARCYSKPSYYPLLEPSIVEFDDRKGLIEQEIKSYNADIICLEEVDKKDVAFFSSLYPNTEYSFFFPKKPYSSDLTCILIRNSLQIIESKVIEHASNDGKKFKVSQMVVAKHPSGVYLLIVACHLKADTYTSFADVRLKQTQESTKELEECSAKYSKEGKVITVIGGDFNARPDSETVKEFLLNQTLNLKSVFHDEPYTMFQMVGDNEYRVKTVIDHVLYSDNLHLTHKIEAPAEGSVGEDGLLSPGFPSDHLSLYCSFTFRS